MTARGTFISFEGGEGAGKTTQINRLAEFLTMQGHKVVTTREPGGTPEAEAIRNLLVQRGELNWPPLSETLMMFAARAVHIEKVIKPALEEGKILICDRFSDSTYAYQGYGRGLSIEKIKEIDSIVTGNLTPDLTFILDIDVNIGLARSNKRLAANKGYEKTEDRFERMDTVFHEKLRSGFLEIGEKNKKRCVVINAAQSIDEIFSEIKQITQSRLSI